MTASSWKVETPPRPDPAQAVAAFFREDPARILTVAPLICAIFLIAVFAQVRFVLGSWPLVYGDDAGDWVVMPRKGTSLISEITGVESRARRRCTSRRRSRGTGSGSPGPMGECSSSRAISSA